MPQYLLQIYTPHERPPADDPGMDMDNWIAFTKGLEDSGMLIGSNRLTPADTATTVRVRDGETLITDGPFAETNEYLAGYYLIEAPNLDVALEHAARTPNMNYGSVEVRPVMENTFEVEPYEQDTSEA